MMTLLVSNSWASAKGSASVKSNNVSRSRIQAPSFGLVASIQWWPDSNYIRTHLSDRRGGSIILFGARQLLQNDDERRYFQDRFQPDLRRRISRYGPGTGRSTALARRRRPRRSCSPSGRRGLKLTG